jgi:hypothetical protein
VQCHVPAALPPPGHLAGGDNLPSGDSAWWESYRNRLESAAHEAARR